MSARLGGDVLGVVSVSTRRSCWIAVSSGAGVGRCRASAFEDQGSAKNGSARRVDDAVSPVSLFLAGEDAPWLLEAAASAVAPSVSAELRGTSRFRSDDVRRSTDCRRRSSGAHHKPPRCVFSRGHRERHAAATSGVEDALGTCGAGIVTADGFEKRARIDDRSAASRPRTSVKTTRFVRAMGPALAFAPAGSTEIVRATNGSRSRLRPKPRRGGAKQTPALGRCVRDLSREPSRTVARSAHHVRRWNTGEIAAGDTRAY